MRAASLQRVPVPFPAKIHRRALQLDIVWHVLYSSRE